MVGGTQKHAKERHSGRWVGLALALGYLVLAATAASGAAISAPAASTTAATAAPAEPTEMKATDSPAATPPAAPASTGINTLVGNEPQAAEPAASETPATTKPAAEAATPAAKESGSTLRAAMLSDGKGKFSAKNEDLTNVLEMLSHEFQLNIIATKNVKGRVTANLYNVTMDQILDAICRSNGLKWMRENNSIYILTAEDEAAIRKDETRLVTEVYPLKFLSSEEALKLVTPALSAKTTTAVNTAAEKGIPSGATGGTGGNSFGLPDSIIIRDFPENHAQVRDILKRMDRRPRQVLVEATILKVTLDDATSLGVDFNALAGVDFRELSTTTIPIVDPTTRANNATVTAPIDTRPLAQIRAEGFASPGKGLNIGIMTNNVAVFVSALEEVTDTTILSNPKVLALNKQRAEVIVGDRVPYRTTTTTETTTVQTVNFLDTGTQLVFRPFISDDGLIRMEIHPKVSSAVLIGDPLDPMPRETTTEVTCNIMVRDGHTIVIGGLFDENSSITRQQIPGMGNLPLIGPLFRSNKDSSKRNEIIILLTPHIIDDDEAANAMGQQSLADAKRLCLGLREGFAWYTRERITAWHLEQADKAWNRYEKTGSWFDRTAALWGAQLALNVGPNNLRAMRLKDHALTAWKGHPVYPQTWTIWDSLQDRLKEMDEARKFPAPEPEPATPQVQAPAPAVEKPVPAPAAAPADVKPALAPQSEPKQTSAAPDAASSAALPAAPATASVEVVATTLEAATDAPELEEETDEN